MTNFTDTLRDLAVGDSHAILRRVPIKKHDHAAMQEELLKMNRSVGTLASRVGGLTVERVNTLNASGTHVIYGLVVTREKQS